MGQYHAIYNVTKKEYIAIGGAKLWEQAHAATAAALLLLLSNSNGRGGGDFNIYPKDYKKFTKVELADQAAIDKVSGRWAGDSIVVQGDYAKASDPAFIETTKDYKNINSLVADALLIADNGDNSEVAQIIESEVGHSYGSITPLSVVKVTGKCRNNRTTKLWCAVPEEPVKRMKKRA